MQQAGEGKVWCGVQRQQGFHPGSDRYSQNLWGEVGKDGFDLILCKLEPHNQVVRGNHNFLNPGRSTAGREKNSLFHHVLPLNASVHTKVFKSWL